MDVAVSPQALCNSKTALQISVDISHPESRPAAGNFHQRDVISDGHNLGANGIATRLAGEARPQQTARVKDAEYLVASPYPGAQHLLDTSVLDPQNRAMAHALTLLKPLRQDYATCAYEMAFNWEQVMQFLVDLVNKGQFVWKHHPFYVVEFRSKLKKGIDSELLYMLDKQSHAEASESGGLLKYWYGTPDEMRYNLATCKLSHNLAVLPC